MKIATALTAASGRLLGRESTVYTPQYWLVIWDSVRYLPSAHDVEVCGWKNETSAQVQKGKVYSLEQILSLLKDLSGEEFEEIEFNGQGFIPK